MSLILNRLRPNRAISPQPYGGLFRQLFDLRGTPALELPGSLTGTIVAENDRPENLHPQGSVPFSQGLIVGALAGNTSHAGVRNLVASGYLATVWLVINNENAAATVFAVGFLFPTNGNLVTVAQVAPSDSRLTTFAPGLFTTSFQGANQSNVVARVALIAGDTQPFGPFIMAPNSDLFVTAAINQVVSITAYGYTRPLRAVQLQR